METTTEIENALKAVAELEFVYCPKCSTKLTKKYIDGGLRNYCPKCQYIQYINPLPCVAVIIERDRKILIGKRSQNSIEGGKWGIPCGFIEYGESHLEAAYREVYEETNLEIEITSLVGVSSNQIAPSLHSIVTIFTANVIAGNPKAGDDLVELRWVSKNSEFPRMVFEADKIAIIRCLENDVIRIPIDRELWINRK